MAAKHASSPSKTFAGPVILRVFTPATLATAPSGARFPWRMMMCPVGCIGPISGLITFCLRLINAWHVFQVFGDGLAGDGQAIAVQKAGLEQRLHHRGGAAHLVQIDIT